MAIALLFTTHVHTSLIEGGSWRWRWLAHCVQESESQFQFMNGPVVTFQCGWPAMSTDERRPPPPLVSGWPVVWALLSEGKSLIHTRLLQRAPVERAPLRSHPCPDAYSLSDVGDVT
jgi:hypothetical protein